MGAPTINYVVADPIAGVPAFTASGTFATSAGVYPPVPLGQEVRFKDNQTGTAIGPGAVAVMCQGSNVSSAGQLVQIINGSAVLATYGNSLSNYPLGIAGAAMTATNVYGWVGIKGKFDNGCYTNVACATGAPFYLPSGTAGQFQTSNTASNAYGELRGIVIPNSFTSTDGSATSLAVAYGALTVQLERPFMLMRSATNVAW